MVQLIAEEVIMGVAQWLIGVVNHSLQPKAAPQEKVKEESVVNGSAATEQVLLKLSTLVERLYERDQAIIALEARISAFEKSIEKSLENDDASEQHMESSIESITTLEGHLAHLENRLSYVEALTQQVDSLTEKLTHVEELKQRVDSLTEVLVC